MFYKLSDIGSPNKNGETLQWIHPQDYHIDAPYSFKSIMQGDKIVHDFRFPKLRLAKGAKITDIVCFVPISSSFFIVSDIFLRLIESFLNTEFSVFELPIYLHNGEQQLFFALHFETTANENFIDWKQTTFKIQQGYQNVIEGGIIINSYSDFLKMAQEVGLHNHLQSIRLEHLVVNKEFNLDFFYLRTPSTGVYCSERFAKALTDNAIRGIHVRPLQW